MKHKSLTILFSLKCNYTCSHCGFSCGPWREEKMPLEKAMGYIEQAVRNPDLEMVAYTGGEPFLFYEEIRQLMNFAYGKGISGGLVTNCYWADSYQEALNILEELKKIGLIEIITSIDEYHLKHVPLRYFKNMVKAALGLKIKVGINVLRTKTSRLKKANVPDLLGVPDNIVDNLERFWMMESSPLPVGRAASFFKRNQLYHYGEAELIYNPCNYVIRNTVVTPDGSFMGCCGFGGSTSKGPSFITYAGNLEKEDMDVLFNSLKGNLFLNIIARKSPYVLLKMVEERFPELQFRREYINNCDICEEISHNTPLRKAVSIILKELAAK